MIGLSLTVGDGPEMLDDAALGRLVVVRRHDEEAVHAEVGAPERVRWTDSAVE